MILGLGKAHEAARFHYPCRRRGSRVAAQSDDWNHVLGDQALQSLWIMHSDKEVRERQFLATIAGLIGIAPQDESRA